MFHLVLISTKIWGYRYIVHKVLYIKKKSYYSFPVIMHRIGVRVSVKSSIPNILVLYTILKYVIH